MLRDYYNKTTQDTVGRGSNIEVSVKSKDIEKEEEVSNSTNDLSISDLELYANIPPQDDPFVLYLIQYISNLSYILDKIGSIKRAEKSLKKKLKDSQILYRKLTREVNLQDSFQGEVTTIEDALLDVDSLEGTLSDFNKEGV